MILLLLKSMGIGRRQFEEDGQQYYSTNKGSVIGYSNGNNRYEKNPARSKDEYRGKEMACS